MALELFQDFLSNLVSRQRALFSGDESSPIDELLSKLMSSVGEVSGIVTARQVLDHYFQLNDEAKLAFFQDLEQNYNADPEAVARAFDAYDVEQSSANLNKLSSVAEPRRLELLRRLNQTPGATHDLVAMRKDLLKFAREHRELKAVDEDFLRVFKSWFGRGFLQLKTIDWSTSAAVLERIIRYEAVHEIKDWDDLRSRIDPPNRRCFGFFHPALIDEPLIFVEVALMDEVPGDITTILDSAEAGSKSGMAPAPDDEEGGEAEPEKGPISNEMAPELPTEHKVAVFYSISNCQPGLKNVSFGNFLIKQVVEELKHEFPSLKTFVTLSPIPGFSTWLNKQEEEEPEELANLKAEVARLGDDPAVLAEHEELIRKCVFNYLIMAKRDMYPRDPVQRFHLGNGASLHLVHTCADMSNRGIRQSMGTMVNYLYDPKQIERNHEGYAAEGAIEYNDKLKSLLLKL